MRSHQNFTGISNWSTLTKGDNHNSAFAQGQETNGACDQGASATPCINASNGHL